MKKMLKYLLPGIVLMVNSLLVYCVESDLYKIRGRIVEAIISQKVDDEKMKVTVSDLAVNLENFIFLCRAKLSKAEIMFGVTGMKKKE